MKTELLTCWECCPSWPVRVATSRRLTWLLNQEAVNGYAIRAGGNSWTSGKRENCEVCESCGDCRQ